MGRNVGIAVLHHSARTLVAAAILMLAYSCRPPRRAANITKPLRSPSR